MLASLSFYSFIYVLTTFNLQNLKKSFIEKLPEKPLGGFLIFNSLLIGSMWLGVVAPPLIRGDLYPEQLQHYTTLIVQGLDLSILLPASFLSGWFLIRKSKIGYLMAPIYFVFLSLLMTALSAKIIGMAITDVNPGPAIIIIPLINFITIICTIVILRNIHTNSTSICPVIIQ
jgi:hypothetical protein